MEPFSSKQKKHNTKTLYQKEATKAKLLFQGISQYNMQGFLKCSTTRNRREIMQESNKEDV